MPVFTSGVDVFLNNIAQSTHRLKVIFYLIWTTQVKYVYLFVCLQDASHPGPSPSSAGVLVPPKVASITSELLAHAKVQLPLNMWVHLKVLSAHPPASCVFLPLLPPLRSVSQQFLRSRHDFLNLPPGSVKNISSFEPSIFWPRSTTSATIFTPPLVKDEIPVRKGKYSRTALPQLCDAYISVSQQGSTAVAVTRVAKNDYFHYQLNCRLS